MRKLAFAGLFACAGIFTVAVQSPKAGAAALKPSDFNNSSSVQFSLAVLNEVSEPEAQPAAADTPQVHTVRPGETLVDIAKQHETSWKRLFFKNKDIEHPDIIEAGDKLTVPEPDEKLKERPIQRVEAQPEPRPARSRASAKRSTTVRSTATRRITFRGSSAGNRYVRGYCTWYAKNRRPDLPNNLGNAITWASRAAAQGIRTGRTPRAGAIGQQGNHVVYVERVNPGGTVTVSEMNFKGWGVVSRRTVPASYFTYIY